MMMTKSHPSPCTPHPLSVAQLMYQATWLSCNQLRHDDAPRLGNFKRKPHSTVDAIARRRQMLESQKTFVKATRA